MKEYTIIFNGKPEKWVVSDKEMTFYKAQEWIKTQGGTPSTVCDLWSVDSDTKKPRWLLFKEAGAEVWVWCEESPEEIWKDNACNAYYAFLYNGYVSYLNRSNRCALCRVGF